VGSPDAALDLTLLQHNGFAVQQRFWDFCCAVQRRSRMCSYFGLLPMQLDRLALVFVQAAQEVQKFLLILLKAAFGILIIVVVLVVVDVPVHLITPRQSHSRLRNGLQKVKLQREDHFVIVPLLSWVVVMMVLVLILVAVLVLPSTENIVRVPQFVGAVARSHVHVQGHSIHFEFSQAVTIQPQQRGIRSSISNSIRTCHDLLRGGQTHSVHGDHFLVVFNVVLTLMLRMFMV